MRPFHILFTVPSGNRAIARVTIGEGNIIAVLIEWYEKPDDRDSADGDECVVRGLKAVGLDAVLGESAMFLTREAAELRQSGYLAKSAVRVNKN